MPPLPSGKRVRLKPADSFDLIRLLARSQYDARKAVCELIQNSLDAQARHIDVTWLNEGGARCLRILDDGQGIFPELDREDALRRIARTIGHSHKRSLSVEERHELMMLGKYGIGLLGFWSIGGVMEIRSRVGGGESSVLRLVEDNPEAHLRRVPARKLTEPDTYTQVTIRGVHASAQRHLRPGRLQIYLANELRGQLLRRSVKITLRDRVARGRTQKFFEVKPARFRGKPLSRLKTLSVPGHDDAFLELYLIPAEEERSGRVALACGGATVLENLAQVDGLDAPRAPWDSGRFEGVVDFGDLNVAPSTRRGFVPDTAAHAFFEALPELEQGLSEILELDEQRRDEERHQDLARQIRRAFVSVATALPQYDLFDVRSRRANEDSSNGAQDGIGLRELAAQDETSSDGDAPFSTEDDSTRGDAPEELFPPGPVHTIVIRPRRSRIASGTQRDLVASGTDRDGRAAREPISWHWRLSGPGALGFDGSRATYTAPEMDGHAEILATATDGPHRAEATAEIQVLATLAGQEKASGIPEPHPIPAPDEPWRSRLRGNRWEFNSAHRDYLAACDNPGRRLRYMIHLFAKELVLRNFGGPGDANVLERMVEVLTHIADGKAPMVRSKKKRG